MRNYHTTSRWGMELQRYIYKAINIYWSHIYLVSDPRSLHEKLPSLIGPQYWRCFEYERPQSALLNGHH